MVKTSDSQLHPLSRLLPIVVSSVTIALIRYELNRWARSRPVVPTPAPPTTSTEPEPLELRNAGLSYRPLGEPGSPYPPWLRALKGKSGVYVIRETRRNGETEIVYVGESHTDRLYHTLTRHFQTWRRSKKFWTGQYGGQGHDPGLTYPRDRVTVAVRVLPSHRAIEEEARLIARLRPRDNLIGQPDAADEDVVPF